MLLRRCASLGRKRVASPRQRQRVAAEAGGVARRSYTWETVYRNSARMEGIRAKKGFLCDLGGTIYSGDTLHEGVAPFMDWCRDTKKKILFTTNISDLSSKALQSKLSKMGLDVPEEYFFTSPMATAQFLQSQAPNASVFVLGEECLYNELQAVGLNIRTDIDAKGFVDYVVMGDKEYYSRADIFKGVNLVRNGAKLIGTNSEAFEQRDLGFREPTIGSYIGIIEKTTGVNAFFVGKPSPIMMRKALEQLGLHTAETAVIGDSMWTDIVAGVEGSIDTVLVLSGITRRNHFKERNRWGYLPHCIIESVGDLAPPQYHRKHNKGIREVVVDSAKMATAY